MTTRRFRFAVAAVLMLTAVSVPTTVAQQREVGPIERVNLITRPAVIYLEMAWEGRVRDTRDDLLWLEDPISVTGACSGSVIDPDGYVLTAGHCVDPGINGAASSFFDVVVNSYVESGQVEPENADAFYQEVAENSAIEDTSGDPITPKVTVYRGVIEKGERSGESFDAEVLNYSTLVETDVALLKVKASGLPTIAISDETDIGVGTPIVAIGYPGSVAEIIDVTLEPSVKEGTISAKRTIGGFPRYEISAASTQGMSGGPITDLDGRVLAVVSSAPASERQSFNFVAPISGAEDMLEDNRVRNEPAPVDGPYREGLEQLFDAEFDAAKASFVDVLEADPKHQQAYELRAEAAKREQASGGGGGGLPVWPIVPVVLLGAGAFVFARRRGGTPVPAPAAEPASVAPADELANLGAGQGEGLVCPHCGNVAQRPVAFCTKCGRSMSADVAAPPSEMPSVSPTALEPAGRRKWVVPAAVGGVVLAALVIVSVNLGSDDEPSGPQRTAGLLGGTATSTPEAERPSLSGTWDSNFGPVALKHRAVDDDLEAVKVTGSWEQGEGKHGKISGGTFDPSNGTLEIEYIETWTEVEGTASFELSPDGTTLTGTYDQPGAKGAWVLSRLANAAS